MDNNDILDDLLDDQFNDLPEGLVDAVIDCAKYAKIFVVISVCYNVFRFILNWRVMSSYQDSISDVYGNLYIYRLQSVALSLISLTSLYFLWHFSKKGMTMKLNRNEEFENTLKSLKHYFLASLLVVIFYKIMEFLGPYLGQFTSY